MTQYGKTLPAKRATQAHVDSRTCTTGRAVRSVFHAVDAQVVVGFTPQSTFSRSQLVRTSDGYQRRVLISALEIFGYQVRQMDVAAGQCDRCCLLTCTVHLPTITTVGGLGTEPLSLQIDTILQYDVTGCQQEAVTQTP